VDLGELLCLVALLLVVVLAFATFRRGPGLMEVAPKHDAFLKGVLDGALVIGARLLEHFVEQVVPSGRLPKVPVLGRSDKICVGGVALRLRLLLGLLLRALLGGRLGDVFLLASLRLLVLPEDGFDRLLTRGELVAMSINSLALVGVLRPSLLTRSRQVVPARNASMTSESVMLGSSVCCFENRRMYSRRDSPGCWRQLRRSQEFPGRTYVPWKFPAKALTRSSQLEIYAGGRCSSQAQAASERNMGRLQMMRLSSSVPPNWQASR
jgi:hypothetical protein